MGSGAVLFGVLLAVVLAVAVVALISTRQPALPPSGLVVADSSPAAYVQRAKRLLQTTPGCDVSDLGDGTLLVRRTYTPSWRFAVAVCFFPIGLLAIRGKRTDSATIQATVVDGTTTISFDGQLRGAILTCLRRTLA